MVEEIEEESIPIVGEEEAKEILKSVSLDGAKEKKKPGPRAKKDQPTPEELGKLTEKEVLEGLDAKTKELYFEFNTFLEKSADIVQDEGTKTTISTGIDLLDAIMGGGFAVGTLSVVTGQPGGGKSMLSTQVIGSAQRIFNGNILAAYLDSEESMTTIRMSNLGVKQPKLKPYTDVTVEKVFKLLEGMCLFKEQRGIVNIPSIVVWDSVANTLTMKEREATDVNSVIGYRGKVLSLLIPKYVAKLSKYNISLIAVNQLRDVINIGMFRQPKELKFLSGDKDIPGGQALKFNAFHLLEMHIKSVIKDEKYGFDGILVRTRCVKNKLFPPNIDVEIVGNFVTGFSNFWTNFNFLAENKRLVSPGGWNYLEDIPQKKFRTTDAVELYNTDQSFKDVFDRAVKETIQKEIIDKNNVVI